MQIGSQQVSAPGSTPPAQRPTHWKLERSPLGHWALVVQTTQVWVSRRQCGVEPEQSASLLQPTWAGTHLCVVGSQASPLGQLSGVVVHPVVAPPAPPEPP